MLRSFANQQSLKNHYVEFYDVDEIKHFYRKLFMKDNVFVPIKCFRCDYFCINRREKKNHNFLTHYQLGGRQPIEDKPLKNTLFDENLNKGTAQIFQSMELFIIFTISEKPCQNF